MGGTQSQEGDSLLGKKSKKRDSQDDGCIGNTKVRTMTLACLICIFAVFGVGFFLNTHKLYNDSWFQPDFVKNATTAFMLIVVGAFIMIFFSIFTVLGAVAEKENLQKFNGIGLILGGLAYIIGWTWYVKEYYDLSTRFESELWTPTESQKERLNMQAAGLFGEAFLPSVISMLLGLDLYMNIFATESKRLFTNLGNLFITCCLCGPIYWRLTDDSGQSLYNPQYTDAYPWIALGYSILWWTTLVYILLWICTCCTCDCKDTAFARILVALGLIIGGIVTSVGYWIMAGGIQGLPSINSNSSAYGAYYVGFTILIGGYAVVWALDIALEDIKNR